jgi:hypothetical protein
MLSVKGVGIPTELTCPRMQREQAAHQVRQKRPFSGVQRLSGMHLLPGLRARRARPHPAGGTQPRSRHGQILPEMQQAHGHQTGQIWRIHGLQRFSRVQPHRIGQRRRQRQERRRQMPRAGLQGQILEKKSKRGKIFTAATAIRIAPSPLGTNPWTKRARCAAHLTWWKKAASAKEPILPV